MNFPQNFVFLTVISGDLNCDKIFMVFHDNDSICYPNPIKVTAQHEDLSFLQQAFS